MKEIKTRIFLGEKILLKVLKMFVLIYTPPQGVDRQNERGR